MTSADGAIVALPYNQDAAGLAYRAEMAKRVFGIDSPGEAMELFADWESLLNKSLEQKERGISLCCSIVWEMWGLCCLIRQTNPIRRRIR